jgi:hypothetical protein
VNKGFRERVKKLEVTETKKGLWRSKKKRKHTEETDMRRNLRAHRGADPVRITSVFTVDVSPFKR